MANKDPAVLLYTSDFLTGVADLTMEERGQYITLLCMQHQKGHLSEKTICLTVGNVSVDVMSKFQKDDEGFYFNGRMEQESDKRSKYINSRVENGKKGGRKKTICKSYAKPYGKATRKRTDNDNDNENIIKDIVEYLNSKAGTKYKENSKDNIKHITARLKDDFTEQDFYTVIDKKTAEWKGSEFEKFLRPETLFGNKFESYLNQKEVKKKSSNPFKDALKEQIDEQNRSNNALDNNQSNISRLLQGGRIGE